MPRKRFARREDLGLTRAEFAVLRRLSTPQKIQAFLYGLKQNFELHGDTCRPVRVVLRTRSAHCIEGAMLAACALWVHGRPPLLMDMRAVRDFDHVVTLIRRNGCWGAISKTNAIGLRWRDPVYRSLREYSIPFDLRAIDPKIWVSGEKNCWTVPERLEELRHFRLVGGRHLKTMVRRDPFERRIGAMLQYRRPRALLEKLARRKGK